MPRTTHTYAILDVAPATFKDLEARLTAAVGERIFKLDYLDAHTRDGRLVLFGTTAIRSEDDPARGADAVKHRPIVHAHALCNLTVQAFTDEDRKAADK